MSTGRRSSQRPERGSIGRSRRDALETMALLGLDFGSQQMQQMTSGHWGNSRHETAVVVTEAKVYHSRYLREAGDAIS